MSWIPGRFRISLAGIVGGLPRGNSGPLGPLFASGSLSEYCAVERVWSQLKAAWGKHMASLDAAYSHENMTQDVR